MKKIFLPLYSAVSKAAKNQAAMYRAATQANHAINEKNHDVYNSFVFNMIHWK